MPAIIVQILITLALKFGLPWILTKFPGIPASVIQIIEKLIEDLQNHKMAKKELLDQAKEKALNACKGSCEVK